MMKGISPMKRHIPLLALAITLSGCPGPDTGPDTSANPEPTPTATVKPDDQPALEIKTLGLVKAEITASSFALGLPTYQLYLPPFGHLSPLDGPPPTGTIEYYKPFGDIPNAYTGTNDNDATHVFTWISAESIVDDMIITMGGQPATSRTLSDGVMRVTFPAQAHGDLRVTRPEGSTFVVKTSNRDSYPPSYTFDDSRTILADETEYYAYHAATASLTVKVRELSGEPSTGLTAAHFSLSTQGATILHPPLRGTIVTVTESTAGTYALTATFEDLSGRGATTRKLTLRVGNPSLKTEVTP